RMRGVAAAFPLCPQHLPRWVSDDDVESGLRRSRGFLMKHLGEFQLPVKKTLTRCGGLRMVQERLRDVTGEYASATQDLVDQGTERFRRARMDSAREPAGAPQVCNPLPRGQRTGAALECGQ